MTNENLARLIGHNFGDGYIHPNKFYFVYVNSSQKLLENIKQTVLKEFRNVKINESLSGKGVPRLQFSSIVGKKLLAIGGVSGSKIDKVVNIPQWIINGNEKIKANFLAALFDDEGYFRDEKGSKQIVIKFSKNVLLEENLNEYLETIRNLLRDLDIKASKVKDDQIKINNKGRLVISKRIWITGKRNFVIFKEKIPILHPLKLERLSRMTE